LAISTYADAGNTANRLENSTDTFMGLTAGSLVMFRIKSANGGSVAQFRAFVVDQTPTRRYSVSWAVPDGTFQVVYVAIPGGVTSVSSLGIEFDAFSGADTIYLDDVWAWK
jgi:hypothetical protein